MLILIFYPYVTLYASRNHSTLGKLNIVFTAEAIMETQTPLGLSVIPHRKDGGWGEKHVRLKLWNYLMFQQSLDFPQRMSEIWLKDKGIYPFPPEGYLLWKSET